MKEKLTLTIEKEVKEQAKHAAKRRGVSVSRMVEQFLKSVSEEEVDWRPRKGSVVSKLSGSIRLKDTGESYSEIVTDALMEKYGYGKSTD
ncbi:DUF6364 family protein [soil metagenome]